MPAGPSPEDATPTGGGWKASIRGANSFLRLCGWSERHAPLILAILAGWMLAVGVVKLALDPPSLDFSLENRWWQIAMNLEHGHGYTACKPEYFPFCGPDNDTTAMREPLPVLTYALIGWLTDDSLLIAGGLNVGLNVLIMLVVYCLGREIHRPATGLLASGIWSIYLPAVRLSYDQLSGDFFATLATTLALLCLLRGMQTGRSIDWLLFGACIGAAALSRSSLLIVAVVHILCLFVPSRPPSPPGRRSLRESPVILVTVAVIIVVSPWLVRNAMVFDRPVFGTTLSGYYLYRQSHVLPSDDYLRFVSGGEFEAVINDLVERRTDLTGTENEAQMDSVYRNEALGVIRDEPIRYVVASLYRGLMLWFNWGVNAAYGQPTTALDIIMMVQQLSIMVPALIGMWHIRIRHWFLIVSVLAFSGVHMAVQAHLAYVLPIMPLVTVLGALGIVTRVGMWAQIGSLYDGEVRPQASIVDTRRR